MKKLKLGSRMLSVLMALALTLGLLPAQAFALETGEEETAYGAEQLSDNDGAAVQAVGTTSESYGNVNDYKAAWKDANYQAGTYTVTANIKMPGQYNPVLTGVDVYANNPNNPFGPTVDPDDPYTDASTVVGAAPTTPLSNNAEVTVGTDGTVRLRLPIQNAIFTTQKVGTCENLAYTAIKLDKDYTYGANTIHGRVYLLDATLGKTDLTNGVATYIFKGSELYALPLNLQFKPDGDVALELTVDLSGIPEKTTSDEPVSLDTDFTGWLTKSAEENGLRVDVYGNPDGTGVFNKETDTYVNKASNMEIHVKEFTREGAADYAKLYAISLQNTGLGFAMTWPKWYPSNPTGAGTIMDESKSALILTVQAQSSKSEFYLVEDTGTPGEAKKLQTKQTADGKTQILVDPGLYPGNAGNQHCLPQITDAYDANGVGTANRPAYYVAEKLPDDGSQSFTPGSITRTAPLDLCVSEEYNTKSCRSERKSIDKLKTEGWKWEQNADGTGGTLTLKNFYLYGTPESAAAFSPTNHYWLSLSDNVTIVLKGTNVIEVNDPWFIGEIGTHCSSAHDPKITIMEGEEGGSLELKLSDKVTALTTGYPYVSGTSIELKSGTFKTNLSYGTIFNETFTVSGGLFEIDVTETSKLLPEEQNMGISGWNSNITVSGGTLRIKGGSWGGIANSILDEDSPAPTLTICGSGSLEIFGSDTGVQVEGPISINTTGTIKIDNMNADSWGIVAGGAMTIENVGTYINTADHPIGRYGSGTVTIAAADYTAVDAALAKVPADLSIYTEESAAAVTAAVEAVDRSKNVLHKDEVAAMAKAIEDAVAALALKQPADYAAVDAALEKIPADLSIYTDETVKAVNDAKDAVVRNLTDDRQADVDAMAKAIEDAVAALVKKPADYTAVDAALAKVPADLGIYTDETAKAVNDAKDAVVRDLTIDRQAEVDAMAKAIEDAVTGLVRRNSGGTTGGGSSGGTKQDTTETVTANLYLDGKYNKVLPGVTVYLNNSNNPLDGSGTPTVPLSDNATLVTKADGTLLLTLELKNPVFTLQKIDDCDNAVVQSKETSSDLLYASGVKGNRSTRISKITFKLKDKSGVYQFEDCEEFPTALNPSANWDSPLVLKVQFTGGSDGSLDSNKDVDTGNITGGGTGSSGNAQTTADVTVDVDGDTADVSKISTKNASDEKDLVLDVTDGEKNVTGAKLPVSDLKELVSAKVPNTKLDLSDTALSFDLAALDAAVKAASGKSLEVRVLTGADAEKKLNAAQKAAVTDAKNGLAVYVDLASDSKSISALGTGKLTVTVPYQWDGKGAVAAWMMDESGKLTSVPVTCKNNKAVLTLSGTGKLVLGTVDKVFSDVAADAYYKAAVDWAVANGVTTGLTENTFGPETVCTRAQTVTFLWRAAGSPEPTKAENPFTDVSADAWYYKAVLWAVEKGITSGVSEKQFAPDAAVSRGQVVTFQWRMAGADKAEGANAFTDVAQDAYYHDAVLWAAKNGITAGTTATTFAPDAGCTRGQIVTFLYRQLAK